MTTNSIAALLVATSTVMSQQAELATPGISRELALARRALVEDVGYDLSFSIEDTSADRVHGHARIRFTLPTEWTASDPVVLDFAGKLEGDVTINQHSGNGTARVEQRHGHLLLPAAALQPTTNTVELSFSSEVAATGTPLTRYLDASTGEAFFYTLVVPADAHRLFPCFDQPDIKAPYRLSVEAPAGWTVIANGSNQGPPRATDGGRSETKLTITKPLPTYLFAFAVGPFATVVEDHDPTDGADPVGAMRLFVRRDQLDHLEADRIFLMHRDSLRWLETYFDTDYPFDKLDLVLLPGFPYGGMEHAGAIFYREASLIFDHEPTESELLRRSTLIYHEVSHQWFGNLVTMEWFDDLWLKEGFATFMGYTLLDVLEPGKHAWLRFHQRVKPRAYAIDATRGTTPIFQQLQNLADAKSAYGAIVYNKAPAVIRELHARLGPEVFRNGVQMFLKRHAFGNARWQDLAKAFDEASERDNSLWSDRWILGAGMPRVRADWTERGGLLETLTICQEPVQGERTAQWPLALDALVVEPNGDHRTVRVTLDGSETSIESGDTPHPAPVCVILNPRDVAYGLFVLDPRSATWLCRHAHELDDLLLRATALSALWNTTREAELDPKEYVDVAIRLLEIEQDPETHAWLLGTIGTTLGRYLPTDVAAKSRTRLRSMLLDQLQREMPGRSLQTLRFLVRYTNDAAVRDFAGGLLSGSTAVPGLTLGDRDRFLVAAALLAAGDPRPLERERQRAGDKDVGKEVYLAAAAAADAATKQRYMESFDQLAEPPEQWMQDCLPFFHWAGQSELTEPFLLDALERVEWVKANRRIFFMPAWLDAFINAHSSASALRTVRGFLDKSSELSTDIRQKILQSLDGLERAVRIRRVFD